MERGLDFDADRMAFAVFGDLVLHCLTVVALVPRGRPVASAMRTAVSLRDESVPLCRAESGPCRDRLYSVDGLMRVFLRASAGRRAGWALRCSGRLGKRGYF